jgi:hypothetical protein
MPPHFAPPPPRIKLQKRIAFFLAVAMKKTLGQFCPPTGDLFV